ncbi:TPA: hypothetical protein ACH1UD_001776, partial [Streptococcus pneumoniae]
RLILSALSLCDSESVSLREVRDKTTTRLTDFHDFKFIFFENLFKPRQLYLQSQNTVLSNLWLAT